jgi:Rrf2 family protein
MKFSKGTAYALHALIYMTRHITQLPLPTNAIAKAEGIPPGYLAKIFQKLAKASIVKATTHQGRGYTFVHPPEQITLLDIFEVFEGKPLFDDCLLHHCQCDGTPENCTIYAQWHEATQKMIKTFSETTLALTAWNHPEHRFDSHPDCPSKGITSS